MFDYLQVTLLNFFIRLTAAVAKFGEQDWVGILRDEQYKIVVRLKPLLVILFLDNLNIFC